MSRVGVVIPAAGRGERAGSGTPKQFREIAGVPMLLRTLRPFSSHPKVEDIVVALPPAMVDSPPEWLAAALGERLTAVPGGETRAESVLAGLQALDPACDVVLVHDAARPFVSRETIDTVIGIAEQGVGAVPCVPVAETVKRTAKGSGDVVETVSREGLWRAQTPQGFPAKTIRDAYQAARGREHEFTDDASVVEANGATVRVVVDNSSNIKVTSPEDFIVAEALAAR